jgi:hypothetical protein
MNASGQERRTRSHPEELDLFFQVSGDTAHSTQLWDLEILGKLHRGV